MPDCKACQFKPPVITHLAMEYIQTFNECIVYRDGMGGLSSMVGWILEKKYANFEDLQLKMASFIGIANGKVSAWSSAKTKNGTPNK